MSLGRVLPVLLFFLLLAPTASAAYCPNHYDKYPEWASLPGSGMVEDAVWTGEEILTLYEENGSVSLLRVDPDTGAVADGPYLPTPFTKSLRLVAAEDRLYAIGWEDRVIEIDLTSGTSSVWEQRLPSSIRFPALAYDGDAVYLFGGLTDEITRLNLDTETAEVVGHFPSNMAPGGAAVGEEYIYIVGGHGIAGRPPCENFLCNEILRFDPDTGDVEETGARLGAPAPGATATWSNGSLLVMPHSNSLYGHRGTVIQYWPGNQSTHLRQNLTIRTTENAVWTGDAFVFFGAWTQKEQFHGSTAIERHEPGNAAPVVNVSQRYETPSLSPVLRAYYEDPDGSDDGRPDIEEVRYAWGDCTASGRKGHAYDRPGRYNVTVYAVDKEGGTGVDTTTVKVNTPPDISFDVETSGLEAELGNLSYRDPDGERLDIQIGWGDGNNTTVPARLVHQYGAEGTYTITVTAHDDHGGQDIRKRTVHMFSPNAETAQESNDSPGPGAVAVIPLVAIVAVGMGGSTGRGRRFG